MLTKNDLQQIGTVIDQKLKPIHQKIDKIDKKLDTTISYFDTVTTKHQKRLKRIENHLNLPVIPEFV
jgi:hypothetical protein